MIKLRILNLWLSLTHRDLIFPYYRSLHATSLGMHVLSSKRSKQCTVLSRVMPFDDLFLGWYHQFLPQPFLSPQSTWAATTLISAEPLCTQDLMQRRIFKWLLSTICPTLPNTSGWLKVQHFAYRRFLAPCLCLSSPVKEPQKAGVEKTLSPESLSENTLGIRYDSGWSILRFIPNLA